LWEITIKIGAGELKVPGSDVSFLSDNLAPFGIGVLPILLAYPGAFSDCHTITAIPLIAY
jgi:PIN domain nuclease of toxin-antitoxin system